MRYKNAKHLSVTLLHSSHASVGIHTPSIHICRSLTFLLPYRPRISRVWLSKYMK